MFDISATVITLNEEKNIGRCLESLGFCREIVVVDSGSDDKTVEIARQYTDKVIVTHWRGYGAQKNFAIYLAKYDWILSVDADEEVSAELSDSITALLPDNRYKGYYINRHTHYLGKWINHGGWYPDYHLRLFNRNCCRWNEQIVHESVRIEGEVARLRGDLRHYSYPTLSSHLQRMDNLTSLAAEKYRRDGKRFNLLKAVFAPPGEFLKKYILKLGFIDGLPGFIMACNSAHYVFLKQAKLYELEINK